MSEILLMQAIVALDLTLNFTAHRKNNCLLAGFNGCENLAMRTAANLVTDVKFPVAVADGTMGLLIVLEDYDAIFYADYEVRTVYPLSLTMTGDYMSLSEFQLYEDDTDDNLQNSQDEI